MRVLLAVVSFLVLLVPNARADIPATISYQGVLTDAAGDPVLDGDYSLRFRLYLTDASTVVWEETQLVAVAGGHFSVELGSVVTLAAVPFDEGYLLGIKVGGDPELAPLTPLTSAPYALTARSVSMAPTTRYHTVCAEAFGPNSDLTAYARSTTRVYPSSAAITSMGAQLHLPHGARLLEFHVLFEDLDATREVFMALRRTNVMDGSFGTVSLVGSGIANAAGDTPVATTNFTDDVIDNQNWAYSLQGFWQSPAGSNLTVVAVRITYEITEPLP